MPRFESLLHVALIVLVGFGYRATFIGQGFDATDEGWLESVARRITLGQVPYRDFRFAFPPVSIYKEAALQAVFRDGYTLLFARWVFVAEVTLGTVLAYLIVSRFVNPRLALLATVPTAFVTVLSYYFTNYTYDADILMLVSAALLAWTTPTKRWPAAAAGVAACLAGLAKPPYLAFVLMVPMLALAMRLLAPERGAHHALVGVYTRWRSFLVAAAVTFLGVLALLAVAGAGRAYIEQAFLESAQTGGHPLTYLIWQDLPDVFAPRELKLFAAVAALLVAAALPWFRRVSWLLVLAVPVGLFAYWVRYVHGGTGFLPMATGLVLVINLVALGIALAARAPWWTSSANAAQLRNRLPAPELVLLALALQYLAQFTLTGVAYSYLGTYLSVPVAVLLLYGLFDAKQAAPRAESMRSPSAIAAALIAAWTIVGSVAYVSDHVYFDAPRSRLTATFTTPKLAGITSNPANVARIDSLVAMINRYSRPGDPILAMPDFGCIYYLTDRTNPTRQDWFLDSDPRFLPPSEIDAVIRDLQRDPPKVVLLETYSEFDWSREVRPDYVFDYPSSPLAPIYFYLIQHYRVADLAGDIQVLVPQTG